MNEITADEKMHKVYLEHVPKILMIPTTSGTGSEGGKSAVIKDLSGTKRIIGDSSLLANLIALDPELTMDLPPKLTFSTGIDALGHCIEAFLVLNKDVLNQNFTSHMIDECDNYALQGINLILTNLPNLVHNPHDLNARQNMQIAALYGAYAFSKGNLGSVHATAHALESEFQIHHGEAIARMLVPVIKFNEKLADIDTSFKIEQLKKIFQIHGFVGSTFTELLSSFLEQFQLGYGLKGLNHKNNFDDLSVKALNDGCNTNPIHVNLDSYKTIFNDASN